VREANVEKPAHKDSPPQVAQAEDVSEGRWAPDNKVGERIPLLQLTPDLPKRLT